MQRLPASVIDALVARLFHFGRFDLLRPAVSRYPRTSAWTCQLIEDGMRQLCEGDASDASIAGATPEVREALFAGLVEAHELEVLVQVSKSLGSKVRSAIARACQSRVPESACFFFARNDLSLLLSLVLGALPAGVIASLNQNHPSPDRCSGSSLGREAEGSLLHVAVAWQAHNTVKLLVDTYSRMELTLDTFDSLMETPLFLAVKVAGEDILSCLLAASADVNKMSGKAYLDKLGRKLDTDNYNAVTPLTIACYMHGVPKVHLLLKHGADFAASNGVDFFESPLMACLIPDCEQSWSAQSAREVIELLLSARADVNGGPASIKAGTPFRSSVYVAARDPWRGVLDLLLARRADVNTPDDFGDPPLAAALHFDRAETVHLLLSHGADVNEKDGDGLPLTFGLAKRGWRCSEGRWRQGARGSGAMKRLASAPAAGSAKKRPAKEVG